MVAGTGVFICLDCVSGCGGAAARRGESKVATFHPRGLVPPSSVETPPEHPHIELPFCSFCVRTEDQVPYLIAGYVARICQDCLRLCSDIIDEEREKRAEREAPSEG
jgi:ATP-dependent protease Clp ATPase subunit